MRAGSNEWTRARLLVLVLAPAVAIAWIVLRLVDLELMTPERRGVMLRDFNSSETGLFAELATTALSCEAVAEEYPIWLAEHPL